MLVYSINYLVLIIMVLVAVAFFTLLERKILSYIQIRSGPNKVSYMGLLQPFSDAMSLISKELVVPVVSNVYPFMMGPGLSLMLILFLWVVYPIYWGLINFLLGVLFFMCCLSLGVYFILMSGWSSNSKYALLGALRGVAQVVSYEVSLALLLIGLFLLVEGYDFEELSKYQFYLWFIFLLFPLGLMWMCSSLAELNRTPFDLVEGESELVSGFNIEYGGVNFALIFISEYASILFMSGVFSLIFLGGYSLMLFLKLSLTGILIVWVRGIMPRFRYDKLMDLAWKGFLPCMLSYLFFIGGFKLFI